MSRTVSVKQYSSFVKGLVTEASPLTYPENASLDEDNFVLKRTGSRERRLGVDYETGYALTATGMAAATVEGTRQSFHKWENPSGNTTVSIGVIRVFDKLWFTDLLTSAPSANLLNAGNPITIANLANAELETAVINNMLILVSQDLDTPIALAYDTLTQLVYQSDVPIQVRDLWGVADGLNINERPTTLSIPHHYNLANQGWTNNIQTTCGTGSATTTTSGTFLTSIAAVIKLAVLTMNAANTYATPSAISCTFSTLGVYPSNSDIWSLGKVGDATSANFEKYDPSAMIRNSVDNVEVAKGHFILDAFNRGLSRRLLLGNNSLLLDQETGRLTTIASFAGRVFYSGVTSNATDVDAKSPNFSNYIFFSQVVTSPDKLGKCYQEADPTSPNISDIIDTDGGAIQIPEATKIVKLIATQSSLLVFAENGIWEVFGDTNGFVATSYQASKISSTGCSSPKSVVEAVGTVFAWTKAGIYILSADPNSGRYKGENLSLLSIQTFYNNISDVAKNNARGFYDERENTIRWLYNDSTTYTSTSYVTRFNSELVLDLTLQAFYPQSFSATSPYIADYVDIPSYTASTVDEAVYVGTDAVLAVADAVIVPNTILESRVTQFSFLTVVGTSFTMSKYNNSSFRDWFTYDGVGVNFSSYLVTGYEVFSDVLRTKQVPYIWFYFKKTEDGFTEDVSGNLQIDNPSACLVKAKWNWTDSAASGQWGSQFQAYRFVRNYIPSGAEDVFDNGLEVIVTKNKLRGSGRSLSLLIESEAGKDMKLLGWAIMAATGATP